MKRVEEHAGAERVKTARFSSVVEAAGKPEVYLPLFDPKQDRAFMRAVKENRVLSVRQEPTAKRADFGHVGFDEQHHNTYLLFPKPLTAFRDSRVVGIKYDVIGDSSFVTGTAPRSLKMPKARVEKSRDKSPAPPSPVVSRAARKLPPPPKRVEPQPKEFRVRVRVTRKSPDNSCGAFSPIFCMSITSEGVMPANWQARSSVPVSANRTIVCIPPLSSTLLFGLAAVCCSAPRQNNTSKCIYHTFSELRRFA